LGYSGLERALQCYQRAGQLGWQFAAQNIERIQKQLDQIGQGAESADE
jgi:hypothetical protein